MARRATLLTTAVAALALGTASQSAFGLEEFEVFDVFAELNDTDGDLGFHYSLDGGPWTFVAIKDPNRHLLWTSRLWGRLRRQNGTEIKFESAEPPFDSEEGEPTLSPEQFFARFREGEYTAIGRSGEGGWLVSSDEFNHVMPAPPVVEITPAPGDGPENEDCDGVVPVGDLVISWDPVVSHHPTIGIDPGEGIVVSLYQVVAEIELDEGDEEFVSVYSVDINPPEETSMTVPEAFVALAAGEELKYEVLAKESEGGNQTAVEGCVEIADEL